MRIRFKIHIQILSSDALLSNERRIKIRRLGFLFKFNNPVFTDADLQEMFSIYSKTYHYVRDNRRVEIFGIVETPLMLANGKPVPLFVYISQRNDFDTMNSVCCLVLARNKYQIKLITNNPNHFPYIGHVAKHTFAEFQKKVVFRYFS